MGLKTEVLKKLYTGADYYVYKALGKGKLDLLQVMYTQEYKVLTDATPLAYNMRTYIGNRSFEIQLLDCDNPSQVILQGPWPTPSTHMRTVDPSAWCDIFGQPCEPDTDWEDETPKNSDQAETTDDHDNKKRHMTD